jgi:hypothetical protein
MERYKVDIGETAASVERRQQAREPNLPFISSPEMMGGGLL